MITIATGITIAALMLISLIGNEKRLQNQEMSAKEVRTKNFKVVTVLCLGVLLGLLLANIWKGANLNLIWLFVLSSILIVTPIAIFVSPLSKKPGYTESIDHILGTALVEGFILLFIGLFWNSIWETAKVIYQFAPWIP